MTKITTRNTKQEIIAAYNAATKELKALKAKGTAAPPASQKALPPSPEEPVRPKANGELSVADIIASLRSLTTSIGESASSLQSELTTEATELQRIREQASAVTRELQTLHGIEVSEGSLAELIARYAESNEKAAEELTAKREAFEKEMNARRGTRSRRTTCARARRPRPSAARPASVTRPSTPTSSSSATPR